MKRYITILFLPICMCASAQDGFSSYFSDTSNAQGSISASVTPFIVEVDSNALHMLSSSIQQPYEISNNGGVVTDSKSAFKLSCAVYPNPASEYLILEILDNQPQGIVFELFDSKGKLLSTREIVSLQTVIAMSSYQADFYILKVSYKNQILQSFKILKK